MDSKVEQSRALYREGLDVIQISKQLDIPKEKVSNYIKDLMFDPRDTFAVLLGDTFGKVFVNEKVLLEAFYRKMNSLRHNLKLRENKEENYNDGYLVKKYKISEEHLIKIIKSMSNIKDESTESGRTKKHDPREIDFSMDQFNGYTESERNFITQKLEEYNNYYSIEAPNDKFGVLDLIDLELHILQARIELKNNPKKEEELNKQLKLYRDMYSKLQADLNLSKKQRDNQKVKEKETIDLTAAINRLDNPIDLLNIDVVNARKEEEEMMRKLGNSYN